MPLDDSSAGVLISEPEEPPAFAILEAFLAMPRSEIDRYEIESESDGVERGELIYRLSRIAYPSLWAAGVTKGLMR